jgi:hypothetical protein
MNNLAHQKAAVGLEHELETYRLGSVTITGEAAKLAKQELEELTLAACQHQGFRALENPKSSALVHEAGHAVLFAYHGIEMRVVKVWQCKKGIRRGHWVGRAQAVEYKWCTGLDTSAEADFKHACIEIAGWIAEALFDPANLRSASSLDEVTQARLLSRNISQKTGVDPNDVIRAICSETGDILMENENVVREIASILDRKGVIRREALGTILAKVERLS